MSREDHCEERMKLEKAVIDAVQALYARRGEGRGPARLIERDAVKALDAHIKQHGCKSPL